jgi:dipeptidyl aminopeptidase/acylaminoacyl peptidase
MTSRPRVAVFSLVLLLVIAGSAWAQPAKHPLRVEDIQKIRDVRDPQCSPDGRSVAYVVSSIDVKEDKSTAHIWVTGYDGRNDRQITFGAESVSQPRWSPDGKFLAFTSSRPGAAKGSQVWLLDQSGGEAFQLTDVKGRLQDFEWSPNSKTLALVIGDPDPEADAEPPAGGKPRVPKPIVIDRYKYKQDGQGYLLSGRHTFLYLFDVTTKKLERLTDGSSDEASPSWSPDGSKIAFFTNRAKDPDREQAGQIFVVDAKPGSTAKALSPVANLASRTKVEWSADGSRIAYMESDEQKFGAYGMSHLATVATNASAAPGRFAAAEALDRGVSGVRFSADQKSLEFLVVDNRSVYPMRAALAGGAAERLMSGSIVLSSWNREGACSVALSGGNDRATEVHAIEGTRLRQITRQNDALFAELQLGQTEEVSFKSATGPEVHGLLTKPMGYVAGTKVPFLLRIHGGPNSQDQHTFSAERQFFAANGYAVLAVNYRGSAGRGAKFSRSIWADWGHYEVEDLLAGVDHVVKMGVADPNKLGVGGWSYGGILTDYLIATDNRFKAATSGAGTAFTVAFYGTDQYIIQYDYEIGPPWNPKSWEIYQKVSYPFLHADRIKTPTLFLGGERDFNVPIQGSQQMYQALRSLGVDTQLIIYPNENHGIVRPSYVKDRYERYLAWYDKYLKNGKP